MSLQRSTRWHVIGHAGAILVGILLAWTAAQSGGKGGSSTTTGTTDGGAAAVSSRAVQSVGRGVDAVTTRGRSAAFQEAWSQALARKIPLDEKRQLLKRLLAEWAEVDLDGALAAAADAHDPRWMMGDAASYFGAFKEKMKKDPEMFWQAIREERFGLATADLRNLWMEEVGAQNPSVLAGHMSELGPLARARAIKACLEGLHGKPGGKELFKQIGELPDSPENRPTFAAVVKYLRDGVDPDSLIGDIQTTTSPGERRLLLDGLTWSLARSGEDPAIIRKQFDALPEDVKHATALALMAKSEGETPALAMMDYLIEQGDWAAMADKVPKQLDNLAYASDDPKKLIDWAQSLPEREEAEGAYRAAMRGLMLKEPEEARAWLETLPAGWQRDNALVKYAEVSLASHTDAKAAEWALGQIGNDRIREEAKNAIKNRPANEN